MMRRFSLALACLLACADGGGGGSGGESTGSTLDSSGAELGPGTGEDGSCPPTLVDCGGCVDIESDAMHCGGCDMPCGADETCMAGECATPCTDAATPTPCGAVCTDLDSDPAHCGSCDIVCPPDAICSEGLCACPATGAMPCLDGCTDPLTNEANCGMCDDPCPAGQPCIGATCVDATIHHILITGQSLSEGATSNVVSTEQPYDNIMFNTGVRAGGVNLVDFVPLVEAEVGGAGETIASGSANLLHELVEPRGFGMRVLASAHGVSGQPYSVIMKGTAAYANGMAQVAAGSMIAGAMGQVHAVRGVAVIHGESDHLGGNAVYDQNLLQWQLDYETDVQAMLGQTLPVPMFYCQLSSFTAYGSATSAIPGLQMAAALARPDKMFLIGPKYFLPYTDGVHLTGDGERWLGEYYAKAFARVLADGQSWIPVRPREVVRVDATITIEFDVPAPPLVLDEVLVANPGSFGFEFTDDSGAPPAIVAVDLVDDVTVQITLASAPTGANPRIRYAFTGVPGAPAGPTTGARGNLRDSDSTPSRFDYPLFNWAVHFEAPAP